MRNETVIFPGSFDPITNGHLDIIKRAAALFESVVVLVAQNNEKKSLYSVDQRIQFIIKSVDAYSNVSVISWSGLTVEFMKQKNIRTIVRGERNTIDFEVENQLALMNKKLYIECETVFLPAAPELVALSSTVLRDLLKHGVDVSSFVPDAICEVLNEKKYVNTI